MTQSISLDGSALTTVRRDTIELTEIAHHGDPGFGTMVCDDDSAALIPVGLKPLTVTQSAAPSGNRRVFTGSSTKRHFRRGTQFMIGASREIEVELVDVNDHLGRHVLRGTTWNRPRETIAARLTALLASSFVDFVDAGLVVYPSTFVDKNDYRGSTPGDLIADISASCGYNYFLYYDEATDQLALFFDDSNTSEAFTSTAKISNAAGDADGTTVFSPLQEEELVRDPEQVASGMVANYEKGSVYRTKAATAIAFTSRDMVATTSTAKTRTQAIRLADRLLNDHDEEDDEITSCTIYVLPANVNDIRAGQRMQVKMTHFPGYESYTWVRVLRRTVSQPDRTDFRYRIDLDLSPQRPLCVNPTELLAAHASVTGAVGVESGDVTWAHASISGWFGSPVDTAVDTIPVYNPANANDGDTSTFSYVPPETLRGAGTVAAYWQADLDGEYEICRIMGTVEVGSTSWQSRPPDRIDYWDGAAWVALGGAYTYTPTFPLPKYWVKAAGITTSKLRLVHVQVADPGILGLWVFMPLGVRVWDWLAYGDAA